MKVLRADLINMPGAQVPVIQYIRCLNVRGFEAVEYLESKQDVFRGECTTVIPLTYRGEWVYHFVLTAEIRSGEPRIGNAAKLQTSVPIFVIYPDRVGSSVVRATSQASA